jgi:hypothetical protein
MGLYVLALSLEREREAPLVAQPATGEGSCEKLHQAHESVHFVHQSWQNPARCLAERKSHQLFGRTQLGSACCAFLAADPSDNAKEIGCDGRLKFCRR